MFENFSFEMGADGIIPFFNLVYGDNSYNLLGFLQNSDVLHLITYMRDAVGAFLIMSCVITVIEGIPDILHGRYTWGKTFDYYEIDHTKE